MAKQKKNVTQDEVSIAAMEMYEACDGINALADRLSKSVSHVDPLPDVTDNISTLNTVCRWCLEFANRLIAVQELQIQQAKIDEMAKERERLQAEAAALGTREGA